MTIEVVDGALAALRNEPTAFAHETRLATAVERGMGDVFVVEALPTIADRHEGRADAPERVKDVAARIALALGVLTMGGCYTSHAPEHDADSATEPSWTRPSWPGPGPAPDPCGAYPPAFLIGFFTIEPPWVPGDRSDPSSYRWVFSRGIPGSIRPGCAAWRADAACVLPDCGPADLEEDGSALRACIADPNEAPEYAAYRESDASAWCLFATREECECECMGRCS